MEVEYLDLEDYILGQGLQPEIVAPGAHMATVDAAAAAMGVPPERIFKSVLLQARDGRCVMVVACGTGRIDLARVEGLTGLKNLRLAKPAVVLAQTGYPAGGTPPLGHRERFPVVVDARVLAQGWGYGGGGRPELLLKIQSADIVRLTGASVADVSRTLNTDGVER